jgi:hypothetical protein
MPDQHCSFDKDYTHCKAGTIGLHGTEVDVVTVKAVDVAVTVEVCFKNAGSAACKIVLKKIRFPGRGCAYGL